jgi:hypothetical protein
MLKTIIYYLAFPLRKDILCELNHNDATKYTRYQNLLYPI